ncbi:MAG: hypothetical protein JO121_11690 [Deltaproteobacteria bacterium]|nr:hypothetical protein [Deltaproteobacteria bacterium]
MRIDGFLGISVCCLLATSSGNSIVVQVPQAEIQTVNARWTSFGVKVPQEGLILSEPFEPPYSRRSFVVPPTWFFDVAKARRDNPNFAVSASAMREDLPVLRLAIEKVYIANDSMQHRGWDWAGFFDDWDAQLAVMGDDQIPLEAALAPWERVRYFQPDDHFRPFIAGFHAYDPPEEQTAILASAPNGACTAIDLVGGVTIELAADDPRTQPQAVQAWDGSHLSPAWYVRYRPRSESILSITCNGQTIGLTNPEESELSPGGPVYESLGSGIAYLRLPFLYDYEGDKALTDVLAKADGLGKERVLLMDLRGGGGGQAPTSILTHWFTSSEISSVLPESEIQTTESCFKDGVTFNLFQFLSLTLKPPLEPDMIQRMQAVADVQGTTPAGDCEVRKSVRHIGDTSPQTPFSERPTDPSRTRIIVITDGSCGSDCTWMAYLLSRLPNTVLVGTPWLDQGGDITGTNVPGLLVLPHTRIPFVIGTQQNMGAGETTTEVLLPTANAGMMPSLVRLAHTLGPMN